MTQDIRAALPAHRRRPAWLMPLLRRIHLYAGLFVGPFILIAALTGALYAFSPQLERAVYSQELTAPDSGDHLPLQEQVDAAQAHRASTEQQGQLAAVRPAPEPGSTTRVMFQDPDAGSGSHEELQAVFVDPATAEIRGEQPVYGTSGSLPLRTEIAQMHRHLFLGDIGRLYSELAASWLGIVILAGVGLWVHRWRASRRHRAGGGSSTNSPGGRRGLLLPLRRPRGLRRTRSWHAAVGIWTAAGGLFLAATGITWSTYAGANVADLREALDWQTPSAQTALEEARDADADAGAAQHDSHAHHGEGEGEHSAPAPDAADVDQILSAGREAGLTEAQVELNAPSAEGEAWSLRDVSMTLPAPEVQEIAVDPETAEVTDAVAWEDYPLMAQLAQWGIWMHMGTLFGPANQLLLFVTAVGIGALVIWGYVMWWQRGRSLPRRSALSRAPWWGRVLTVLVSLGVGVFLPALGLSLLAFLLVDWLLSLRRRR